MGSEQKGAAGLAAGSGTAGWGQSPTGTDKQSLPRGSFLCQLAAAPPSPRPPVLVPPLVPYNWLCQAPDRESDDPVCGSSRL